MRIKYKEPYWLKFNWDLTTHHEHQFVTEFNKTENERIRDFFYCENWMIVVGFTIPKDGQKDEICAVFGKSGKNLALSYNTTSGVLGFEFWTTQGDEDKPTFIHFKEISRDDVEKGITVAIIRDGNSIVLTKIENGKLRFLNRQEFIGTIIEDYKNSPLMLGCANPGTSLEHHRFHGEIDVDYLLMVDNLSDDMVIVDIINTETEKLVGKSYYSNILSLHNFKKSNNMGFVYDESMYTNFLERVPSEFIIDSN